MVLLHLPLEDAPHVLNRVQVWRHTWPHHHLQLQQQGSCHLGGMFGVVVMLENSFWREGIIFLHSLESMFHSMNRSSPVPAVVMQPQTMMLPPPCLTVGKSTIVLALLTRASPHMMHTIWVKQVYLRLIRPQDMVPVIHALGQVVFSKLFAGFFCELASEDASFWDDAHANRLVSVCGVWSEHWQADLLQPLNQCWQHLCICVLMPASAPKAQHKDSSSLIDPCEACSEWNQSWKTSVWPWPLYCNSVPVCYWTSYSLGHLCGEQQF